MSSIYAKISAVLLVLLLALALVQLGLWDRTFTSFVAETDQKLNRSLAADLAGKFSPHLADSLDYASIEHKFHELMVMNPRVEIYLIDQAGGLLAYFADPAKIKRMQVDIDPVMAFIQEDADTRFPLYGDDPRSPSGLKPFSAVPVTIGEDKPGYLYVILGGEQYESTSSMVQDSYTLRTAAWMLSGTFALAGVTGLVLFLWVTNRLRTVTRTVHRFSTGDHEARVVTKSNDEIAQLGVAFNQMADTLAENIRRLKSNDDLRRELVANVSHDLRSPLASIQGYVETLAMKDADLTSEERQAFLTTVLTNVKMLSRLVTELFELSRLDANQMQPQLEPFSVAELAQDAALKFQPQADERRIDLAVEVPRNLPLVFGDVSMIDRALTNLIENGVKFTPEGGRVAIVLDAESSGVSVSVTDSGDGIPAEDLPFIFDRFYRGDKSRRKRGSGTGLGLAIAQKLIQAHDSTLSVTSQINRGTTFSFSLSAA